MSAQCVQRWFFGVVLGLAILGVGAVLMSLRVQQVGLYNDEEKMEGFECITWSQVMFLDN